VGAFAGTLNPSSGDISVFLPLEQARLAEAAHGDARTTLFARYGLTAALCAALGALAAGAPDGLATLGVDHLAALRIMFVVYGAVGFVVWMLYLRLPTLSMEAPPNPPAPLGPSRGIVVRLARRAAGGLRSAQDCI
jgi:hypothetical protein